MPSAIFVFVAWEWSAKHGLTELEQHGTEPNQTEVSVKCQMLLYLIAWQIA